MIEVPKMRQLRLEIMEGTIARLTINRPEKMNALNTDCFYDLNTFCDFLNDHSEIKAGIIIGEGKAFAAGIEAGEIKGDEYFFKNLFKESLEKLEYCRKPTIAAINGYALGGGLELALSCDIRILSEKAVIGFPECGLATIPGAGGIQRMVHIAGVGVTKELVLTGRRIRAEEACRKGLGSSVVPTDQLLEAAFEMAQSIAGQGPIALTLAKRSIDLAVGMDKHTGLIMEDWAMYLCKKTADSVEGKTALIEKRKPNFKGC